MNRILFERVQLCLGLPTHWGPGANCSSQTAKEVSNLPYTVAVCCFLREKFFAAHQHVQSYVNLVVKESLQPQIYT